MKTLVTIAFCVISLMTNAQKINSNKEFNLLAQFTVKPESLADFKEACIHSLYESRKEEGNIEMKLYADNNKNNVFYVYSRWENEAAYELHKTLPHSKNIAKVGKATLMNPPKIMPLGLTQPITARGAKRVNPGDKEENLFFIFKIKDGYSERVIKRFETHVKQSRKEKGNLLFDFYTIEGDDNSFVVYESWRNMTALKDIHLKTSYSEETLALLKEAMVGEVSQYMNFLTELEPNTSEQLNKKWEVSGFKFPESVVPDPNSDWIYVSNIVNRESPGYISRVSKNGKVDKYKWITGLNQPCGLAIYKNLLYVGDQDKVHIINIKEAKIIKSLSAEGAVTLNDVTISNKGQVFISDVMSGRIYTIENDKLIVWIENTPFKHPNGLYADGKSLMVADLGDKLQPDFSPEVPGSVYKVIISTKEVHEISSGEKLGGLDGITKVGKSYMVTNNSGGKLYAIDKKGRKELGSFNRGIADLSSEGTIIYIPNFAGTVTAYSLK